MEEQTDEVIVVDMDDRVVVLRINMDIRDLKLRVISLRFVGIRETAIT